ncbi:MAG: hypothetical protein JO250_07290 [Armatimonadetes bacterium]|nr:hypothetical protein [Armatimonadota bacterium]
MPLSSTEPSMLTMLEAVRAQFPGIPFLALGQTALWDEPTKAVWRRLLDAHLPDAKLIAGVHDTDYFAKTTAHLGDDQPYVMLPHNDGRTRDLWSAAGELSCLFGSESVPTRHMFLQHGVPFDWLAQGYSGGKDALYADATVAWGWRGIVHTESHNVVARDVPTTQIGPALLEQLDWGFAESLACLADPGTREAGERTARTIRSWVTEFLETCSDDCRLGDLYQTLLPKFYELLLGAPPAHFETTSSTELFRFSRETCSLPRFEIVNTFLDPATRAAARRAYDRAVAGSGIYTLDEFGEGAIPFDLVVPGHGRGTVRLTPRGLIVQTAPNPTDLTQAGPVRTLAEMAEVIESRFGPECALVGKAVTLVDMLAAEFLVVFHETASGYTTLTQTFNTGLREAGLPLSLYPLVRLRYPTWDALAAAPPTAALRLPAHLAQAFRQETVGAAEFGARWRGVVEDQRRRLRESRAPRKVRELLRFLDSQGEGCWCDRLEEYESALNTLKELAGQSGVLGDRIAEHRRQLAIWRQERLALEARKGEDWRANIQPLRERIRQAEAAGQDSARLQRDVDRQLAIRATAFDVPLAEARERITATRHLIAEFRRQRRLLERGPEARQARARIEAITREAQMARLRLVRDAFLTVEGLEHTNYRPTAWWLPMVTPGGEWLSAMAAGTQARLEEL